MIRSDYQNWVLLSTGQMRSLSSLDVYKACVISANNGIRRNEEDGLGQYQQKLLSVRRTMKAGHFDSAKRILLSLRDENPNSSIDVGDREFLRGLVMHRLGDQFAAAAQLAVAAKVFSETGDTHRLFRALINEKISAATQVQAYLAGDLYVLQKESQREGYFDLAGTVYCARAGELIVVERFTEAMIDAYEAIACFNQAGCPEDMAQSQMMLVIAQFLSGDTDGAKDAYASVRIHDGKITPYIEIYKALLAGKKPKPPAGHALFGTPWRVQGFKKESINGKIIAQLGKGPVTRDELIISVWGESATHPSYCNRLYSALNQIRKTTPYQIQFDGEKYILVI